MRENADVALRYYELADAGRMQDIYALHHDDIRYDRPGHGTIQGKPALIAFFEHDRNVAWVQHELRTVLADGDEVAVEGYSRGQTTDGRNLETTFADFFLVVGGLIKERRGYLGGSAP